MSSPLAISTNSPKKTILSPMKSDLNGKENAIKGERISIKDERLAPPKKRSSDEENDNSPSPPKLKKKSPGSLLKTISLTENRESKATKTKLASQNIRTGLSDAIRALHTSTPASLPCRNEMVERISGVMRLCLQSRTSSTMYISGPPGTGKTACLNYIISLSEFTSKFIVVNVNCTAIKSASSVYSKIAFELGLKLKSRTEKACLEALLNYIKRPHKMILMVLDEIDQLESKRQSILYTIFEWPSLPSADIVLVGIANALDLTDRILPRLQTRIKVKPTLIQFAPYTLAEISDILTQRLSESGVDKVLSGLPLQMLARRVAAISGDIRQALDVARRVLELAQQDQNQEPSSISIQNVMKVVDDVYSTTTILQNSDDDQSPSSFPLQQKLLICSALLIRQNSKCKELTLGKLHDVYKKICEKRNIGYLDLSEFISSAELVESRGIIKIQGKSRNRLSKAAIQWDENEISIALKDKELLSSVLRDLAVLPR